MADRKKVILCIDDDEDVLMSLRLVLEQHGYAVVEAGTAEEGLTKFKAQKPDLIIVDLMMEEVDAGAHFVKEVMALGGTIPIYMLSSVGDQLNLSTDYASLGLSGVFQKPINTKMLVKTLKSKLG
jgi:CheY-like chemotaxis protein